MKKLLIGIPGWKIGENSFGATTNHLEFIARFGTPVILMPGEMRDIQALYLPGGADIYTSSYGEVPGFKTGSPDLHKQYFYDNMLEKYMELNIPIFGVCLGFQMLCVKHKARINQDLLFHPQSDNRWEEGHKVQLSELATQIIMKEHLSAEQRKKYGVNSHHHQGIMTANLPETIVPLATHDGVLEAMIIKQKPIAGVQWHPEEFYDSLAVSLFEHIISMKYDEENNPKEKVNANIVVG